MVCVQFLLKIKVTPAKFRVVRKKKRPKFDRTSQVAGLQVAPPYGGATRHAKSRMMMGKKIGQT